MAFWPTSLSHDDEQDNLPINQLNKRHADGQKTDRQTVSQSAYGQISSEAYGRQLNIWTFGYNSDTNSQDRLHVCMYLWYLYLYK